MKKIIIYGIKVKRCKTRRYIENFLSEKYEIIGYSDGHYQSDILDHKPFFSPEEISEQQVDFVLVNVENPEVYREIQRYLNMLGVPMEKIIRPRMFLNEYKALPVDLIENIKNEYAQEKGLIFGLSYSVHGIMEKDLEFPFYNCSWTSLDLYYNYRIYEYMCKHKIFTHINTAMWVFPYYYFDYDYSLSAQAYHGGDISALWQLNDWHHYQNVPGAAEYVENYKMFAEKMMQFYRIPNCKYNHARIYGEIDNIHMLGPLWFKNYESTVEENKKLFVEFYSTLTKKGTNVFLVIPPFYINALNKESKNAFHLKKEKFYQILHELEKEVGKILVFDYSERFSEKRDIFYDPTHLNFDGAAKFTKILNDQLKGSAFK